MDAGPAWLFDATNRNLIEWLMLNAPTLNAVVLLFAHNSSGFAFQRLSTKHFIVSMRNDFPILPMPLINMQVAEKLGLKILKKQSIPN